jgi:hypothetical protein
MAICRDALRTAPSNGVGPAPHAALMTAGYCHQDPWVVAELHTLRLFGGQVIPHFQAKKARAAVA